MSKSFSLNYKTIGSGPAVIILHGLFGMLDNWQTIGKKLASSYSVYLVDQRNHGKSPHHEELNYPLMAIDLLHFMEEHGIRQANIIGHSMGGKTAMHFAVEYPDMVEKLVIADMGIKAYPPGHESVFNALHSLKPDKVNKRSDAEAILAKLITEFGVRQFLLKNLTREGGHYRWKMNLDAIFKNYHAILNELEWDFPFELPTLFIRGGLSGYIRDEDWSDILEVFPNARLETIEDSGHWVHAEAPVEFYNLVHSFLMKDS